MKVGDKVITTCPISGPISTSWSHRQLPAGARGKITEIITPGYYSERRAWVLFDCSPEVFVHTSDLQVMTVLDDLVSALDASEKFDEPIPAAVESMKTPTEHRQGDSKWKPGDRALIQCGSNREGLGEYDYLMATLVLRDWAGQWWFKLDGETYPRYEGGADLSFCVERWIHEPDVLDKLAAI